MEQLTAYVFYINLIFVFFRAWFGLQISFRVQALINQSFWILFTKQNKKKKRNLNKSVDLLQKKQLLYSDPSIRLE